MKNILFTLFLCVIIISGSFGQENVLILKNQHVAFTFEKGSFALTGLTDLTTHKEHIFPHPLTRELWQLSFAKNDQIITTTNNLSLPGEGVITKNNTGGQTLKILWNDLRLPELKDVKVEVAINLPDDKGIADWHIKVDNNSKEWGLWEVYFPKVSKFLESGTYNVFGSFGHENRRSESWGSLFKEYVGRLDLLYPYGWGNMSMQFIGANNGSSGIYMAAHDPRAWTKKFVIEPGNEFFIKVYAENMGVAGSDYNDPFPVMLGVFRGDWLTAAKIYRTFAITTPWAAKGKVSAATSTPQSFKDVALWMREWIYHVSEDSSYQKNLEKWKKAQTFFGVPLGFHWYNWNIFPFDTHYPHFFPAQKRVSDFARELKDMGIVVMPYINGRIVDKTIEDFATFLPYAAKNFERNTYEEIYPSRKPQMAMCPTSGAYQDSIAETVRILADDINVNSVYIDQIAAGPSDLCFDKSHGHPLGGGSYWVDGYRQMLTKVQKIAHSNGRNLSITSECTAEPFMDGIDGFLMVTGRNDKSIPLLPAVYSGYAIYFASWGESLRLSDQRFIMTLGRDVLWGSKPGWFGFDLFKPENEKKLNYFKTLGQTHYLGRNYFVYGEFLKQFDSGIKTDSLGIPWQMGTLWKNEDGSSLALVLANFSEKAASFPIDMDVADCVQDNERFKKSHDMKNNIRAGVKIENQKITGNVVMEPLEMKIIKITK